MNPNIETQCDQIQMQIFELDESELSELSESEKHLLFLHLQHCELCRALREEDLILTQLLTNGWASEEYAANVPGSNIRTTTRLHIPSKLRLPLIAASLVVAVTAGVWFSRVVEPGSGSIVPDDKMVLNKSELGSINTRPVINYTGHVGATRHLDSANHIDLPAGSVATIGLNGVGSIEVVGPVVLELDRIGDAWKVTLLQGLVKVDVAANHKISVAGESGLYRLSPGKYLIDGNLSNSAFVSKTRDEGQKSNQDQEPQSVAEMADEAMSVFRGGDSTLKQKQRTAELLKQVIEHKDADYTQVMSARFYLAATYANLKEYEKALELANSLRKDHSGYGGEVLLAIIGDSNYQLGKFTEAKQAWNELLELNPDSPYRRGIETMMAEINGENETQPGDAARVAPQDSNEFGPPVFPPELAPPYISAANSKQHVQEQSDGYLVVAVGLDEQNEEHQQFSKVAKKVQAFHEAEIFEFDGKDFNLLRQQIAKHKPANVMFVIPPQLLDVNFHRRIFKLAPTFDNDLQADFAWGYLTARDGEAVGKFWERIRELHEKGFRNQTWLDTSVAGNIKSMVYPEGSLSPAAKAGGFNGKQIYYGSVDQDPEVLDFVDKHISEMERASVVVMSGNGDPQGIWLFDDQRNADPTLHWAFDKNKVGHDPDNELVRIKADKFRELALKSPVIWSGTCHSGACFRVYVESDIVSTFGSSDNVEVYELPPEESLCLALIDAGAGSLLVPIASNHGFSSSLETHFAVTHGATLGETIKSTYDDVYQQAGGIPSLSFVSEGEPDVHREPTMQGTGANRLLIGDPALSLFKQATIPIESAQVELLEDRSGLIVNLEWEKGFHPEAWNIYADAQRRDSRMRVRIPMPDGIGIDDPRLLNVTAELESGDGQQLTCLPVVVVEQFCGKSFLHLQATTNADDMMHGHHRVRFRVNWTGDRSRPTDSAAAEEHLDENKPGARQSDNDSTINVLWSVPLDSPSFGGAAVADLDEDGRLEIAFGTYFDDNSVRVFNAEDGSQLWRYDAGSACLDASVRIFDLDSDGDLELLVPISNLGQMIAFEPDSGKKIWTYQPSPTECTDSPSAICDFDGDGDIEFLYGTFPGNVHLVDAKTGTNERTFKVCDHYIQTSPTIVDINGDGQLDFVCATFKGDNRIYAIDGKSGEQLWTYKIPGEHIGMYHGCSLGDLDEDGTNELAIGAYNGKVYCLSAADGKEKWISEPGDSYVMSPTVIADLDDDGKSEVISASQTVAVIDHTGRIKWKRDLEKAGQYGGATRGASLADLNGDGKLDIATLTGSGIFEVFSGEDGERIYRYDCSHISDFTASQSSHGVTIADCDGDGKLDVFFVIGTTQSRPKQGLAVCLTGFDGKGPGWYMLRHDHQSTGNWKTPITKDLLDRIEQLERK